MDQLRSKGLSPRRVELDGIVVELGAAPSAGSDDERKPERRDTEQDATERAEEQRSLLGIPRGFLRRAAGE